ncbi:hypothetical protein BGZ76_009477 [Entomortierella beljakovae]|nr:hypothetical protein BGZ76_009477 [Entomortierella beljakovae]
MPLARWAFNIRQSLLLENIEPLVTLLTDDSNNIQTIVPVSNLLNYLPKPEADSLLQVRFEDDMRRALVARLMLRAFFAAHHNCYWEHITFDNTVSPEHLVAVSFNISHHGDWVILVGETDTSLNSPVLLGVDVVDFQDQHPGETFESFSACIQDQFTPKEMTFMAEASKESSSASIEGQLKRFYRLWCLKESIVKALDTRDDLDPRSFEFTIQDEEETEKPIHSTIVEVHKPKPELPEEGWSFEEALLDEDHCYAIAAQSDMDKTILDGSEIKRLDWKELLKDAIPYPSSF